ncbi:MAG: 50S ribosomal protein L34 [Candidatus Binataceae bacterium]
MPSRRLRTFNFRNAKRKKQRPGRKRPSPRSGRRWRAARRMRGPSN